MENIFEIKTDFDINSIYELLNKSFPKHEIYEKSHFEKIYSDPNNDFTINSYSSDGELIGVITWWDFGYCIYLEHFAVSTEKRGGGVGSKLLQEFISTFDVPVILECEPKVSDIAERRIAFYERNGMILNPDFKYTNPPMRKNSKPYELVIMSSKMPISCDDFKRWRNDVKNKVYGLLSLD